MAHPVRRIGEPFFRRVAEDGLDLWAYVIPLAGHTQFGDIADGRDLLDQGAVLDLCLGARVLRFEPLAHVPRNTNDAALCHGGDGHLDGKSCVIASVQRDLTRPPAGLLDGLAKQFFQ